MKAIQIHQYGDVNTLQLEDIALPVCAADEILIKIVASGINAIDWKTRSGFMAQIRHLALPFVIGGESAGVVEAVGSAVNNFKVGDKVFAMFHFMNCGGYAEYVTTKAEYAALMPKSISFNTAATLPITSLAAYTIIETAKIEARQKILIHGGAGGVGSLAIQLAKLKGAYVIVTAATKDLELVSSLKANQVIDYQQADFATLLSDIDIVVDTVGGATQEKSWDVLRNSGCLISIVQPPQSPKAAGKNIRAEFVHTMPSSETLQKIANLIDEGKLKPLPITCYPLDEIAKVHTLGETGKLSGRTALII